MGDRWQVEVDRDVCIGSGLCVSAAPGGFRLDAARQSHPVAAETDASEAVLTAAEGCPVEAIAIRLIGGEAGGGGGSRGEQVFPPDE
ncbi:ferredoxin [Streptomyces sp. ME19-01-6]|uniref:ferredoxin n=1 Tax=Streptomyces sp. ME19-01-6 TaxID=3028686 RepID=UPI0029B7A5B6|nr:ferredoxin [Streptomyces sp. ME19-01-6]MDX3224828.1 ferredoxin [Streptomyces sp. ME19-01-6]